jgi:hypothetical protein
MGHSAATGRARPAQTIADVLNWVTAPDQPSSVAQQAIFPFKYNG